MRLQLLRKDASNKCYLVGCIGRSGAELAELSSQRVVPRFPFTVLAPPLEACRIKSGNVVDCRLPLDAES